MVSLNEYNFKGKDSELADQAGDAWRLGFDFGDVIEESTPHLYLSALPFTPSGSFISKQFLPRYPHLLNIEVGQQVRSPPKTGLMKKNCSYATSLAFSPQGKYIATGFQSGEFWFWDGESGEILYQGKAAKRGPSWEDPIHSIVFSPDGQLVYLLGDVDIRILMSKLWKLVTIRAMISLWASVVSAPFPRMVAISLLVLREIQLMVT